MTSTQEQEPIEIPAHYEANLMQDGVAVIAPHSRLERSSQVMEDFGLAIDCDLAAVVEMAPGQEDPSDTVRVFVFDRGRGDKTVAEVNQPLIDRPHEEDDLGDSPKTAAVSKRFIIMDEAAVRAAKQVSEQGGAFTESGGLVQFGSHDEVTLGREHLLKRRLPTTVSRSHVSFSATSDGMLLIADAGGAKSNGTKVYSADPVRVFRRNDETDQV